jgi:hypothetical protein
MNIYLAVLPEVDVAFVLASLFCAADLPCLRYIRVTFHHCPPRLLPEAPHEVKPFGPIDEEFRRPWHQSHFLSTTVASALKRITLRFDTDHKVRVRSGARFIRLLGDASRPEVLHIDSNRHEVEFQDD